MLKMPMQEEKPVEKLKFKDMPYERPDLKAACARIDGLTARLKAAQSYAGAKAAFLSLIHI